MNNKGFTLLELLIVISIIGLLASIVLVAYPSALDKARIAKTMSWAGSVNHSLGDQAVGVWTFDNISGATVYDDSGNNNNGTISGAVQADGVIGKALSFDGIDDYVDAGSGSNLAFLYTAPVTFSVWVYNALAIPASTNFRTIFERTANFGAGYAFSYGYYLSGAYPGYMVWAGFYSGRDGNTAYKIEINQWYHLAAVYDGTNWTIYVNGVAKPTTNQFSGSNAVSTTFTIGKSKADAERMYNGLIDDARIFSEAFTQAQVWQLYAAGLPAHQPLAQQ